jgi:hypothetical protein
MEDTPGQSPDYLAQLDAAFDSLDAQLAAPAARAATPAPLPSLPGALDPGRRPAPPAEASSVSGPAPVFEVDDNWFDKKPVAAESLSGLTEFVVTRAPDFAPPLAPVSEADRSWAPPAVRSESAPVNVPNATDVAVPATPQTTIANSAPPASEPDATPCAPSSASVAPGGPSTTTTSNHADLSDDSIERLTAQLTERVAARVGAPLADRLSSDLPSRLTQDLAVQIVDAVADRVMAHLEPRLVDQLVTRVVSDLTPRVADEVSTRVVNELVSRLGASLATGLSSSIAERVGSGLAEQVAQHTLAGALGENLRQTVHDVAERIVRAEVERIKAAAESRRAS